MQVMKLTLSGCTPEKNSPEGRAEGVLLRISPDNQPQLLEQPCKARPDAPIYALRPPAAAIDNPIASAMIDAMAEASSESPMSGRPRALSE